MRILLTNDDGISSDGLLALQEEMSKFAEVWVVAPDREQSATSHAITLHRPLRIRERKPRWFEVDGKPTDCVFLAINHLMRDVRPDVVCSGINLGPNLGNDVFYSGTVAAAMEAAMLGVSSIAYSLARGADFSAPARFAGQLTREVALRPLPKSTLLNVNFPGAAARTFVVTRLGKRNYGSNVVEKTDPRGRRYYWIGGEEGGFDDIAGSDCNAVLADGVISVTPLNLDLTDHLVLDTIRSWDVQGFTRRA